MKHVRTGDFLKLGLQSHPAQCDLMDCSMESHRLFTKNKVSNCLCQLISKLPESTSLLAFNSYAVLLFFLLLRD